AVYILYGSSLILTAGVTMCGCCGDSPKNENPSSPPVQKNPLKNRGCTDIIFLVIFFLFWVGMVYIAAFSILNGDGFRLLYGYDSYGNTCDRPNQKIGNISLSGLDMTGKKYVFFMDIKDPFNSLQICVDKCPDKKLDSKLELFDFARSSKSNLCSYDTPIEHYRNSTTDKIGPCPVLPVFRSHDVLFRCVPAVLKDFVESYGQALINFLNDSDIFKNILHDLFASWPMMIALCGLALVLAFLMVLLIRYIAACVVWFILALSIVASIACCGVLWWTFYGYHSQMNEAEKTTIPILRIEVENEILFLIYSIIATVLTLILLLIILVMRKRIALTVALFHEAGKCIASMPLILIQPIWTFIALFIFFIYWGIVLAYLSTAGDPYQDQETGFIKYNERAPVRYMWWYHVVGLIWTSEFILANQQMAIAGAVATWFFTRDKKKLSCTMGKSICRLISHHLGSTAFGAFIITLVKLPRYILMWMQQKLKGKTNKCAEFCMKCCICCLWCLEKCLKYLNQNAYTVIAIEGTNFCSAAKKAFTTLVSNVLRVAAINSVGDFVLFLGKIAVMAATCAIGMIWFKTREDLNYYAIPVLLVCVFAYFIAHCFLSVYEMVIDSLLLCFCEDCQMNDGTEGKEYFMSQSLMKFVKNSSEAIARLQKKKAGTDQPDGELEQPESVPMVEKTAI
ncbi:unnamed protein product, partial [Owenia fusiformis]